MLYKDKECDIYCKWEPIVYCSKCKRRLNNESKSNKLVYCPECRRKSQCKSVFNEEKCSKYEDNPCEKECKKRPEPKCPNKRIIPTLLESVSTAPQTVLSGLAVPFTTNLVSSGRGIFHLPGSTEFIITKPGLYKVTFTGTVSTVDATSAGVALAINGIILPGTTVTETPDATGEVALATQTLLTVLPGFNTILTVVNPTTNTQTFINPNIIIERVE